jgi:hypothetical protein
VNIPYRSNRTQNNNLAVGAGHGLHCRVQGRLGVAVAPEVSWTVRGAGRENSAVSSRVRGWSDIFPHRIDEVVAIVR